MFITYKDDYGKTHLTFIKTSDFQFFKNRFDVVEILPYKVF